MASRPLRLGALVLIVAGCGEPPAPGPSSSTRSQPELSASGSSAASSERPAKARTCTIAPSAIPVSLDFAAAASAITKENYRAELQKLEAEVSP